MQGTNALPSRTYPELPAIEAADPAYGGAYGPAAIPARALVNYGQPGPSSPPHSGKGPIAQGQRSGLVVTYPGRSPGLQDEGHVDNTVFHNTIKWSRPFFPNAVPVKDFSAPTHGPSWTANRVTDNAGPASAIPFSKHRIDNFTVREEYGSDRQLFPLWGTRRPLSGRTLQGVRWADQAKTQNPYMNRLTVYGLAGSYGQTTLVLPTQPLNQPANATGFGAY
jgi:hypothetical protein